jgi:hypothetical protein
MLGKVLRSANVVIVLIRMRKNTEASADGATTKTKLFVSNATRNANANVTIGYALNTRMIVQVAANHIVKIASGPVNNARTRLVMLVS